MPKARTKAKPATKNDPVEFLRKQVIAALEELKAKDVQEIDVRGKTSIADILIIANAARSIDEGEADEAAGCNPGGRRRARRSGERVVASLAVGQGRQGKKEGYRHGRRNRGAFVRL